MFISAYKLAMLLSKKFASSISSLFEFIGSNYLLIIFIIFDEVD